MNETELFDIIQNILKKEKIENIEKQTSLKDLDSLETAHLFLTLEKIFEIKLNPQEMKPVDKIIDLITLLRNKF